LVLADQVDDDSAAVSLLDVGQGKGGDLGAPQAAAEERGKDGAVAHAFTRRWVRRVEQTLGVGLATAASETVRS
jgi:hypothetical protein